MLATNITLIQCQLQNILSTQSKNITYEMPTTLCYNIWYGYEIMSQHLKQICIYSPHITRKNPHYPFHTHYKFQIILRS